MHLDHQDVYAWAYAKESHIQKLNNVKDTSPYIRMGHFLRELSLHLGDGFGQCLELFYENLFAEDWLVVLTAWVWKSGSSSGACWTWRSGCSPKCLIFCHQSCVSGTHQGVAVHSCLTWVFFCQLLVWSWQCSELGSSLQTGEWWLIDKRISILHQFLVGPL